MKNIIVILSIIAVAASGCKKEESGLGCAINKTAVITLKCTSNNPYEIYLNGEYQQLANPNSTSSITVEAGTQEVKAVQKSGYVFVPTEKTFSREVVACEDMEFSFP